MRVGCVARVLAGAHVCTLLQQPASSSAEQGSDSVSLVAELAVHAKANGRTPHESPFTGITTA